MNNTVKFVIQIFLVSILLPDNYAYLPPTVCLGSQAEITVLLTKNEGRRWEERAVIRSLLEDFAVYGGRAPSSALWPPGATFTHFQPQFFSSFSSYPMLKVESRTTATHTSRSPRRLLFVTLGRQGLSALRCWWDSPS